MENGFPGLPGFANGLPARPPLGPKEAAGAGAAGVDVELVHHLDRGSQQISHMSPRAAPCN